MKPLLMTLWNNVADSINETFIDTAILIKNAKIQINNDRKHLTHTPETIITNNVQSDECINLKTWYDEEGKRKLINVITKLAFNNNEQN